jgi:hypothetical protein
VRTRAPSAGRRTYNFTGAIEVDGYNRHVSEDVKNGVRAHISSNPKIESHYTRAHSEKSILKVVK